MGTRKESLCCREWQRKKGANLTNIIQSGPLNPAFIYKHRRCGRFVIPNPKHKAVVFCFVEQVLTLVVCRVAGSPWSVALFLTVWQDPVTSWFSCRTAAWRKDLKCPSTLTLECTPVLTLTNSS